MRPSCMHLYLSLLMLLLGRYCTSAPPHIHRYLLLSLSCLQVSLSLSLAWAYLIRSTIKPSINPPHHGFQDRHPSFSLSLFPSPIPATFFHPHNGHFRSTPPVWVSSHHPRQAWSRGAEEASRSESVCTYSLGYGSEIDGQLSAISPYSQHFSDMAPTLEQGKLKMGGTYIPLFSSILQACTD